MPRKTRFKVVVVATILLVTLAVSWLWRVEPPTPGLVFQEGDGSISPLFVMITRGRLETNYEATASGTKSARVGYAHRFYCSRERVVPVPALRYWAESGLRWLGIQSEAVSTTMTTFPTSTDISVLWVGYRATNSVLSEDAVLLSDCGPQVALAPGIGQTLIARSERLVCWKLPTLLTNRGKYSLILTSRNATLLTFEYE